MSTMKSKGLCCLVASVMSAGILVSSVSAQGPQIVFEETTHDFGKIMEGESARHDFTFSNPGDATLEIKQIKTTCGCTKAAKWDKTVEPGGTGKIPIALKTKGISGNTKKSIHVTTNVPGQEKLTLWLKGKVWRPVEMKPRHAAFGAIQDVHAVQSKTVTITSHLEEPLKIVEVKSSHEAFQTELKAVTPGKEYELKIAIVPPLKVGSTRGTITLKTSSTQKPEISIPASCYVPVPVQVAPSRLVLFGVPLAQAMERAVYVTHNVSGPLKIRDVEVNAEDVDVRVVEMIAGKRFRILLQFPAGFDIPEEGALRLTFKTDDPSAPTVEVPITQAASRSPRKVERLKRASGSRKPEATPSEE